MIDILIDKLKRKEEVLWCNAKKLPYATAAKNISLSLSDIQDASDRLERFAPYFKVAFPETVKFNGIIESPLVQIPKMKSVLEKDNEVTLPGNLWLKLDSHLPISGSIKARGGIYEVLTVAEKIVISKGLLNSGDDYGLFDTPELKKVLSNYSISVGSTGNLGLSIGIISAKLGFHVVVHMSSEARQWKKDLLRSKGVEVIEYDSNYSEAVKNGRIFAKKDPNCHFIDDENSKELFLGYSVAAFRLREQLSELGIVVDREHPLMVYLPCGVGGAPGGITFGLKQVFGDAVNCYFAEPTEACSMLLGLVTGMHNDISVQDIGLEGRTDADGLAVGRPSKFVGKLVENLISGCYTLSDERMYRMLAQLADTESIYLEPSALAGMYGPVILNKFGGVRDLQKNSLGATHIIWATGGSMVPVDEMNKYYNLGKSLLNK